MWYVRTYYGCAFPFYRCSSNVFSSFSWSRPIQSLSTINNLLSIWLNNMEGDASYQAQLLSVKLTSPSSPQSPHSRRMGYFSSVYNLQIDILSHHVWLFLCSHLRFVRSIVWRLHPTPTSIWELARTADCLFATILSKREVCLVRISHPILFSSFSLLLLPNYILKVSKVVTAMQSAGAS